MASAAHDTLKLILEQFRLASVRYDQRRTFCDDSIYCSLRSNVARA
ncbi:hypothetical protein SS05631_a46190 (plasmid) [Sinorhizobium sp. CCBAU 05631]|nr:hypothetical protein SS05631_a46190 [Sinorhizobium sp. CCBAU 05631]